MVRIVDFKERKNSEGESFFALIIQGSLEMVMSQETERYYATSKRASVTSTFDEETCRSLIGQELPGSIQRQKCEEFDWIDPETGEIKKMDHRWVYAKEGETVEEVVFEDEGVTA